MRIDAYLQQSPLIAVARAARRFDALTTAALAADSLNLLQAMVLAALFFEAPRGVKPSQLAETFGTTRGHISQCVSALEARGLLQRRIDPDDARAYLLSLPPSGKKCALRVIATLDKLQNNFETELGKPALHELLKGLRALEQAHTPTMKG